MTRKPQCPFHLVQENLPDAVQKLSYGSNLPVLDAGRLVFKPEAAYGPGGDLVVPSRVHKIAHDLFYLWQGDGSLAVYAYLITPDSQPLGCLHLGFVSPTLWMEREILCP